MEPSKEEQPKRNNKRPEVIRVSYSFVFLPIVFILGLVSGWLIWGRDVSPVQDLTDAAQQPGQTIRREVSVDDDPSIGPDDAPITIIEFSDYQCPFCARWHKEVYGAMMKEYEGRIKFVYRDYPLYSIHPEAEPAAIAANCAGEQNTYWEFHELLFAGSEGLSREAYLEYARQIGLDLEPFTLCLDEKRYQDEIRADYEYASSLGVSSTPTFFINGVALVGAQPLEVFRQAIDAQLAEK